MNGELEKIFKAIGRGLIEVVSWNLPGWTEKNHEKPHSA
jgi:hypothetical protein